MSTSNDKSEKEVYESPLSTEEVYCVLLHKLGIETEKLERHAEKAENTQETDAWGDLRNGADAAKTLQELKSSVFKAMKEKFEDERVSSFHSVDGFLEEKVIRSFKSHTSRNEELIKYLDNELQSIQKQTNLLNTQAKDLETNLAEKKEKEHMTEEQRKAELKRKEGLVAQKHRKLVRGVRSVTAAIHPRNQELDNILGILLDRYFTPRPYVDEEEGWEVLVEYLLRTEMVTRHPDDPSKIRLVDFF